MLKLFLLMSLIYNCSAFAEISINTNQKDVRIEEIKPNHDTIKLGLLPIKIKSEKNVIREFLIEKEGFSPEKLVLFGQKDHDSYEIEINLRALEDWSTEVMQQKMLQAAEKLTDEVLFAQSLIQTKQMVPALEKIRELETKFPNSISVKLLYANYALVEKDYAVAKERFQKILLNLPKEKESMRPLIESLMKFIDVKGK